MAQGREILPLDGTWRFRMDPTDVGVRLCFVPKKIPPEDALGIFCVTVPHALFTPGKLCTISVVSKGIGSRRWFALNRYADVAGPGR